MAARDVQLLLSEVAFNDMVVAGLTSDWLRRWLREAGAARVSLSLLASPRDVAWSAVRILVVAEAAWLDAMADQLRGAGWQLEALALENPPRSGWLALSGDQRAVLLPLGDLIYCRARWLAALMGAECVDGLSMTPAEQLLAALQRRGWLLRTVESCTGGAIAAQLCAVPGASAVVDRGWITYCNQAKAEMVGVEPALLARYGAVSEPVVRAMAAGGAGERHLCIAVSGIAGPGGGSLEKPVGTVWLAVAWPGVDGVQQLHSWCLQCSGARHAIQTQTVEFSLKHAITCCEGAVDA